MGIMLEVGHVFGKACWLGIRGSFLCLVSAIVVSFVKNLVWFYSGRRGVFDGVVEGLYQHWKHREVVKVITMQRTFTQVIYTAKSLEAESGGILVSVEKLSKGHAIILYRGKNYRRPQKFHSENLLTKREALQRSILMQRIGSLKFFAHQRRQAITNMRSELEQLQKSEERNGI
ncbi:unnamed protein product [Linum tenue]|uniref:CRM domain-containing protein n=1 Tax=Linum tenue TaxID=586396 RepID=A0AAV0MZ51_9ROSI|nr:unnamed protein product [Linum tenue]